MGDVASEQGLCWVHLCRAVFNLNTIGMTGVSLTGSQRQWWRTCMHAPSDPNVASPRPDISATRLMNSLLFSVRFCKKAVNVIMCPMHLLIHAIELQRSDSHCQALQAAVQAKISSTNDII